MKKIKLSTLALFITVASFGQRLRYEKVDSLSAIINNLQAKAAGLTYTDGAGAEHVLSFPEENFKVYYYNLLGNTSVYKKNGSKETLELTENIDFSKAVSITIQSYVNGVARVQVDFPTNIIKTQVFTDGASVEVRNAWVVNLFAAQDYMKLYNDLVTLAHYLKKEKKSFNYQPEELAAKWKKAMDEKSVSGLKNILSSYPNTLYDVQLKKDIQALEKMEAEERQRQEAIRIENERSRQLKEAERIRAEELRQQRLAEEARQAKLKRVGFSAFRLGYLMPTSTESTSLSPVPDYIKNTNSGSMLLTGSSSTPFTFPFAEGRFGLETGASGGFTFNAHLEFINKHLPKFIGFGLPIDLNVAVMRYDWEPLAADAGLYSFLYEGAKHNPFVVISAGMGLSLSLHPADYVFFDFYARPDFYLTTGGNYLAKGSVGNFNYSVAATISDDATGFAHAYGVHFRYKHLLLGFEIKENVVNDTYFNERNLMSDQLLNLDFKYPVDAPGLNLNFRQVSLGYVF